VEPVLALAQEARYVEVDVLLGPEGVPGDLRSGAAVDEGFEEVGVVGYQAAGLAPGSQSTRARSQYQGESPG